MLSKKEIDNIKKTYKAGMRIKLIKMDDIQAPPVGTEGTILGVDDIGDILVRWDNGSSLKVIVGFSDCASKFVMVNSFQTCSKCYNSWC